MALTLTETVTKQLGEQLVRQACRSVTASLQRARATGAVDGLDAHNLWDEICLISRELDPGNPLYDAAEHDIAPYVVAWLAPRTEFEKAALWFLTDVGRDWYEEQLDPENNPEQSGLSHDPEDIVIHIVRQLVKAATDWDNGRIRKYEGGV